MQRDTLGILTWQTLWLIISHLKAIYSIVIIKVYKGGKVCIKKNYWQNNSPSGYALIKT